MRTPFFITALLFGCLVAMPVVAQETTESLAKRVKELEKANLVLQEDLARTQYALDTARTQLKRALDDEIASRKALADALNASTKTQQELANKLDTLQKSAGGDLAKLTAEQKAHADNLAALNKKTDTLQQTLAALADKHAKEIAEVRGELTAGFVKVRDDMAKEYAALKDMVQQQVAALRADLEKERNERIAADDQAAKDREKMVKQARQDRTITYVMGGLLGGLSFAK